MDLFDQAPVLNRPGKKASRQKVDVTLLLATIIDPWAFSYTDSDIGKLNVADKSAVFSARARATEKARECQRVYELNRPKKTVVIKAHGRRVFRKV